MVRAYEGKKGGYAQNGRGREPYIHWYSGFRERGAYAYVHAQAQQASLKQFAWSTTQVRASVHWQRQPELAWKRTQSCTLIKGFSDQR